MNTADTMMPRPADLAEFYGFYDELTAVRNGAIKALLAELDKYPVYKQAMATIDSETWQLQALDLTMYMNWRYMELIFNAPDGMQLFRCVSTRSATAVCVVWMLAELLFLLLRRARPVCWAGPERSPTSPTSRSFLAKGNISQADVTTIAPRIMYVVDVFNISGNVTIIPTSGRVTSLEQHDADRNTAAEEVLMRRARKPDPSAFRALSVSSSTFGPLRIPVVMHVFSHGVKAADNST